MTENKVTSSIMCMRSKTECKTCDSNHNGYCIKVKKSVSDIVKQWKSSNRSKARRKLKQNESFFSEEVIDDILKQAEIIRNSELQSKEMVEAMNELDAIFYHWKVIHTEFL